MTRCPFCGTLAQPIIVDARLSNRSLSYAAMCLSCTARGPRKPSKEDAIEAWSDRLETRPFKGDAIRIDRGEFVRASGDAVCTVCGLILYEHPSVNGFPFLRRHCNGNLIKL